MVFHGNRLEDLRDLTLGLFRSQPLAPLVPETLLVQSNGMKHWLEMALADDSAMGICAATQMELPSSFIWRMYRLVLGQAVVPVAMPSTSTSAVEKEKVTKAEDLLVPCMVGFPYGQFGVSTVASSTT